MTEEPTDRPPALDEEIIKAMRERAEQKRASDTRSAANRATESESEADAPANPYITALVIIAIIGILVGVIFMGIGIGKAGSYSPSLGSSHDDSGAGEIAIGGLVFGSGLTAVFIALGAQAVLWALGRTAKAST